MVKGDWKRAPHVFRTILKTEVRNHFISVNNMNKKHDIIVSFKDDLSLKSVDLPISIPVKKDNIIIGTCFLNKNGIGEIKINDSKVLENIKKFIINKQHE